MIRSFQCQWVEDLYHGVDSGFQHGVSFELQKKIHRLFDFFNALTSLDSVKIPGVDNIVKFPEGYSGFYVTPEWRIVFKWFEGDLYNLDLLRS